MFGWLLYRDDSLATLNCDVSVSVNKASGSGTGQVTYSMTNTPTVTSISPKYGKVIGGIDVTITGTGFGTTAS